MFLNVATKANVGKTLVGQLLLCLLICLLNHPVQAAASRPDSTTLTIQRVALLGSTSLNMELRYIGNKLGYVYFSNAGTPLAITIYANRYQLPQYANLTLPALELPNFVLTVTGLVQKQEEPRQFNTVKTYVFVRDPTGFYRLDTFY